MLLLASVPHSKVLHDGGAKRKLTHLLMGSLPHVENTGHTSTRIKNRLNWECWEFGPSCGGAVEIHAPTGSPCEFVIARVNFPDISGMVMFERTLSPDSAILCHKLLLALTEDWFCSNHSLRPNMIDLLWRRWSDTKILPLYIGHWLSFAIYSTLMKMW